MGTTLTLPTQLTCHKIGSRDWDLMADGTVHGSLRFDNCFGSRAVGETVDARWTFKRNGFFNTWLSARKAGTDFDIATIRRSSWGEYRISFGSGPVFSWKKTKRVRREFGLYDYNGSLIMAATFTRKFFAAEGVITLEANTDKVPELPMLTLFCWYWLVLRDMDEQASAGAAVVAMG